MRLAILSRSPRSYSTRRLREAARRQGHHINVLDTLAFSMSVEAGTPRLLYHNRVIRGFDAVAPRIGASITQYGTAVVRQFEQQGVFTLNTSHAIAVSRDKLRSLQVLSRHNIGIPPTAFVREKRQILPAIERLGGAPVITKLLEGTQGVGVILADTIKVAEAIIETLQSARQNVLIQKFVHESRGRDIRALVVGGHVVAAMRRIAQEGEFRSNVHRGGKAEPVALSPEYERTAIHSAQILGLRVAGVDILEAETGPQVMEVNSSPGLEGIEKATGVDVAGAIVEHAADQLLFPEVDIKQRLTLEKGYGVAEIHVHRRSELQGRTLRECALRERDVQVLSIHRGSVTIPNPHEDTRLCMGDQMLCYGKLLTLKSLLASSQGQRRRRRGDSDAPLEAETQEAAGK